MAQPITARPGRFIVSLSDGETPEAFIAPCGFTGKALNRTRNLNEISIPDCDDPDAAYWVARDVQSITASVSGTGVLATSALPVWEAAFSSIDSINVEIEITFTDGGIATYVGMMQLENFNFGAEQGQRVTIEVSMQSDGELVHTWEPA